jgi:hypothetical protein
MGADMHYSGYRPPDGCHADFTEKQPLISFIVNQSLRIVSSKSVTALQEIHPEKYTMYQFRYFVWYAKLPYGID